MSKPPGNRAHRNTPPPGRVHREPGGGRLPGGGGRGAAPTGQDDLDATLEEAAASVPPGTRDHLDLVDRVDVRGDLAGIRVPALVVSTTYDTLVTPWHHREPADGIPGARLAELPCGHLPFAEAPREWLGLMTGLLEEVRGKSGAVGGGAALRSAV